MGFTDKIKSLFKTLKKNVVYECEACDYETQRKNFKKTQSGSLKCPNCGSERVHIDD